MHLTLRCGSAHLVLDVRRAADGQHLVSVNGAQHVVDAAMLPEAVLTEIIADFTSIKGLLSFQTGPSD